MTPGRCLTFDGSSLVGIAPRGLGTPHVESLTGYLQRLANEYVLPPAVLFRETVVPAVQRDRLWRRSLADLLREHARAIDGTDRPARIAVDCMAGNTGRTELARCAFLGLADLDLVQSDGLLVRHKRWCPSCWADDAAGGFAFYERKLWTLSVVDACPVHSVVLLDRCFACGTQQPPISRDVRPGVCALCGQGLSVSAVHLDDADGTDAARRLWFAREAAVLVHGIDVVAMHGLDRSTLARSREQGLIALADHIARTEVSVAVAKTVNSWLKRWRRPKLEALFSVLWRSRWSVVRLFPKEIQAILELHRYG